VPGLIAFYRAGSKELYNRSRLITARQSSGSDYIREIGAVLNLLLVPAYW